jgi:thioredoxin 1
MQKTAWWKMAVVALLGIAVIGVMQLKAKQAATERPGPDTVATAPGGDEGTAVTPPPAPIEEPVATPPVASTTIKAPAAPAHSTAPPPAPKTAAGKGTTTTTNPPAPKSAPKTAAATNAVPAAKVVPAPAPTPAPVKKATFIELGADKCVPCKMMQPIMEELRADYPETLKVVFHDVWKDPKMADKYGIQGIPTQILLDGDGKEIFRHSGFWPKDDIVAKFQELGIALK